MELRHFAQFDKTASVSIFTRPVKLVSLDGRYGGSGSEFLQIHDKATAAVANDVPLYSFPLSAAGLLPSLLEALGPLSLAYGLSIGISSVNEKYTASSSEYDVEGDVEEYEVQVGGLSTAGDLTTGISSLAVWNNTNPELKRLYRLQTASVSGLTGDRYLQLHGQSGPATGTRPIMEWPIPQASQAIDKYFGVDGFHPYQLTFSGGAGTERQACSFLLSSTSWTYTASTDTLAIKAYYKAS